MIRHFTSTVFVVFKNKIALHWHEKVRMWLPPGGHVDLNEDPIQTALRECKEEMGIDISIFSEHKYKFEDTNLQNINPPQTILIEKVEDNKIGSHEHIDFIYFGYPKDPNFKLLSNWIWVDSKDLMNEVKFKNPELKYFAPPNDVKVLGMDALVKLKNLSK